MIKMNLQLFGGRGAKSGRKTSGNGRNTSKDYSNVGKFLTGNDSDGYLYKGNIPETYFNKAIDTQSTDYKMALRENNVKYQVHTNGSVTVTKGGLYERKRTFKSENDFRNETNKRIDANIAFEEKQMNATKNGRMSQIEADNVKTVFKNNPVSQAAKIIEKERGEDIYRNRTRIAAAESMKRRFNLLND